MWKNFQSKKSIKTNSDQILIQVRQIPTHPQWYWQDGWVEMWSGGEGNPPLCCTGSCSCLADRFPHQTERGSLRSASGQRSVWPVAYRLHACKDGRCWRGYEVGWCSKSKRTPPQRTHDEATALWAWAPLDYLRGKQGHVSDAYSGIQVFINDA